MDYILGVDVGGTKILIGKVYRGGRITDEKRYPSRRGTQQAATEAVISAALDYCQTALRDAERPAALGLGLVGQVDPQNGIWVHSMGTPITTPFPICEVLSRETGFACYADNDVHCATLAEIAYGLGRTVEDFIYLNLGTGTAAGLVSGGRLIRGARNRAGEVGHISCALDENIRCGCGKLNCVEWFASGNGMLRYARGLFERYPRSALERLDREGNLNSQSIFECAEAGDTLARAVAETVLDATVSMVQDMINVFDPAAIVVGGGVLNDGWLLPRVADRVAGWLAPPCRDLTGKILPSSLDPQKVGLLGAAVHAMGRLGWLEGNP